jgi:uncharacterized membrane protein
VGALANLDGAHYWWFFLKVTAATTILFFVVAIFYKGQTYLQDDQAEA